MCGVGLCATSPGRGREHMWGNDGFDRAWLLPQNRVCMELGADNDADNAERTQASTVGSDHDYQDKCFVLVTEPTLYDGDLQHASQ